MVPQSTRSWYKTINQPPSQSAHATRVYNMSKLGSRNASYARNVTSIERGTSSSSTTTIHKQLSRTNIDSAIARALVANHKIHVNYYISLVPLPWFVLNTKNELITYLNIISNDSIRYTLLLITR